MKPILTASIFAFGISACTPAKEAPNMTFEEAKEYCKAAHVSAPRSNTKVGLGIGIDGSGKVRPRAGLGITFDVTPTNIKQKNYESCVIQKSGTPVNATKQS